MPRSPATYKSPIDPKWVEVALAAWDRLGHGQKLEFQKTYKVGKSTVDRLRHNPDQVGFDALEKLRLGLNEKRLCDLPPAISAMRSTPHHAWTLTGAAADAHGELEKMRALVATCTRATRAGWLDELLAWVSLGDRYEALGLLTEMIERYTTHVEGAEDMGASREIDAAKIAKRSEPLPEPPGSPSERASDRTDRTKHGPRKPRQR